MNHATCESCFSAIVAVLKKNFYEAIKFIVVVARFILGMMSRTKDNSSLLDAQLQTTKMCVSRHHDWQNLVLESSNLKTDQQKLYLFTQAHWCPT